MDAKKWLLGGMAAAVFFSAAFAGWMTTDDAPLASVKAHVVATVDAAGQHWQAAPLYLLRATNFASAMRAGMSFSTSRMRSRTNTSCRNL